MPLFWQQDHPIRLLPSEGADHILVVVPQIGLPSMEAPSGIGESHPRLKTLGRLAGAASALRQQNSKPGLTHPISRRCARRTRSDLAVHGCAERGPSTTATHSRPLLLGHLGIPKPATRIRIVANLEIADPSNHLARQHHWCSQHQLRQPPSSSEVPLSKASLEFPICLMLASARSPMR